MEIIPSFVLKSDKRIKNKKKAKKKHGKFEKKNKWKKGFQGKGENKNTREYLSE